MRELTINELLAIGGAACYFACSNNDMDGMTDVEVATMMDLNALAKTLVATSGIDPTALKDLGLEFVKEAQRRGEAC